MAQFPQNEVTPMVDQSAVPCVSLADCELSKEGEVGDEKVETRLRSLIPDYRNPQGNVCRRFLAPGVLLARQLHRLTSKLWWKPRVLVIVANEGRSTTHGHGIMICTEDRQVRRYIAISRITELVILRHREGQTLTMVVDGEHDCILRARMETSVSLNMAQAASIIKYLNRDTDIRNEYMEESREDLKKLVSRGRSLQKPDDFCSPVDEMKRCSAENTKTRMLCQ